MFQAEQSPSHELLYHFQGDFQAISVFKLQVPGIAEPVPLRRELELQEDPEGDTESVTRKGSNGVLGR